MGRRRRMKRQPTIGTIVKDHDTSEYRELTEKQKKTINAMRDVILYMSHGGHKITKFEVSKPGKHFVAVSATTNLPNGNVYTKRNFFVLIGKKGGIKLFSEDMVGYQFERKNWTRHFWHRWRQAQRS